jgi:HD-like signal output (HDOD) protein/CheY-like chemotaxis protein
MNKEKHLILFVDDDPLVLRGIQRSIMKYGDHWDAEFADSGREALLKLSEHNFDAIVTDIHMPGMDGIQLLEEVSGSHPGVIRFILSGNTRDAQLMRSVHLVHQIIPKPCVIEKIHDIIERACCLRGMLLDPDLLNIVTNIRVLPSVPRLYNQLLEEFRSETASSLSVGNIISQDAAMTAKILQLVNSAFFGISEPISSPQRAVTFLGMSSIRSLALGLQVFSEYQNQNNFPISVDVIWQHSLHVSNLAFIMARSLKLEDRECDDARVSGVLHDIGLLLSFQIPGFFDHVKLMESGQVFIESEIKYLGTSHAQMGGYLLGIWGLPNPIVEAVTFHHFPGMQPASQPGLLTALHLANGLLNMYQNENDGNFDPYLDMKYLRMLGLAERLSDWAPMIRDYMIKSTPL